MNGQRGGFVMGLVVGLLAGLALALGVALYITRAPVPFINKVPQRTAEQDLAEAERNRTWDPNSPLAGKVVPRPVTPAAPAASAAEPAASEPTVPAAGAAPARAAAREPAAEPAGRSAASAAAGLPAAPVDAFLYFVQVGAYARVEDAEQQRARLALMGQAARITEREQAGRTVYRVRLGPFPAREEADTLLGQMQEQRIEAQIVRVERP